MREGTEVGELLIGGQIARSYSSKEQVDLWRYTAGGELPQQDRWGLIL
jgi:hypothetical protein